MKKILTLLLLLAFGCQRVEDEAVPSSTQNESHFITAAQAAIIAQTAVSPNPNARQAVNDKPKKVKDQITIDDADDKEKKTKTQPVFYVVNYEEGGYSIISADDRLEPVLAFVEGGPSISKDAELPGGLLMWMKSTKDQIQNIRKNKLTKRVKKGGRASWLVGEKAPMLRTRWNQYAGRFATNWPSFNQQIPYGCPGTDPNGLNEHAYVGCVGVAVAQIVRYWGMQTPWFTTNYQYNWSNSWNGMPIDGYATDNSWEWTNGSGNLDGHFATDEVARLMADAAREVHTNYGCNGSSAAGTTRVVTAFKQYFGYSSASYSSTYRPHDVVANLNMNWPVILGGYTSNILWWGSGSGHSWVCDGYRAFQDEGTEYCYYDEYGSYQCYTPVYYRLELHMNWGWGGSHNGWFSSTYFGADVNGNPMSHNYQCNLDELLDIHP